MIGLYLGFVLSLFMFEHIAYLLSQCFNMKVSHFEAVLSTLGKSFEDNFIHCSKVLVIKI